jgi:hypothetical protein
MFKAIVPIRNSPAGRARTVPQPLVVFAAMPLASRSSASERMTARASVRKVKAGGGEVEARIVPPSIS